MFGGHLTLDIWQCDNDKLNDIALITKLLNELPDKIGMTKIIPPYVFHYSGIVPDENGITGIVLIAESHISIHTFTEKDFVFIDVFSCKPFDFDFVKDYFINEFQARKADYSIISRGINFPR